MAATDTTAGVVDVGDVLVERKTLCICGTAPGSISHCGDDDFADRVKSHFATSESNAAEKLVRLKGRLAVVPHDDFWSVLLEGITDMVGSQYAFVVKRILVDDQDSAVEMPPLGEPGSCLMAVAIYFSDGKAIQGFVKDFKYEAFVGPCSHMKHDKVLVIPDGLQAFIAGQEGQFAFPIAAHMGLPLFSEGKCFAHFAAIWSPEGLQSRNLSWGFVEVALHALEDIITQRLVEGHTLRPKPFPNKPPVVIPSSAVTVAQSLKPYARSLSHELRTPMQGVVGMLEIMHASVQEALEGNSGEEIEKIFKLLRDNIEIVQGSSRRAVEAADNVVHAYDLNMQVPASPIPSREDDDGREAAVKEGVEAVLEPAVATRSLVSGSSVKRRRSPSTDWDIGPTSKHRAISTRSTPAGPVSPRTALLRSAVEESGHLTEVVSKPPEESRPGREPMQLHSPLPAPRATRIRDLLHLVVHESLRIGGRPDSAIAEETDGGEVIEVRTRSPKGDAIVKFVDWKVESSVPDEMVIDERDLAKLISVLFLNALKFTENGRISLVVSLSRNSRYVVINVTDTGLGIPAGFRPNLFKAFSREDDSIRRHSEGLGLGLLVAKGLARRTGGDLICVRSETEGPQRGSEFELKVPLSPCDGASRQSTPSRTPTPSCAFDKPAALGLPEFRTFALNRQRTPSKSSPKLGPTDVAAEEPRSQLRPPTPSGSENDATPGRRLSAIKSMTYDRTLASKHPLTFLVAEDNRINRKLLVSMLAKLGYGTVYEAYDGVEAVRLMELNLAEEAGDRVDVILMDLWMPNMDGYEAAERILALESQRATAGGAGDVATGTPCRGVKILAVTADVTDEALERTRATGMMGFMTKPYKMLDLERLIVEHCSTGRV